MIHDELVTYEVAKLAKEKGFPQHIGNDAYIVENEYDDEYEVGCHYPIQFIPDYLPTITAPTQSLLQRWLREEKGMHIIIDDGFQWGLKDLQRHFMDRDIQVNIGSFGLFDAYEEALHDALLYALQNV